MGKITKAYFKGSSLVETLVAMVLLLTCVSLAALTMNAVLTANANRNRLEAELIVRELYAAAATSGAVPTDTDYRRGNYGVKQQVTVVNQALYRIDLTVARDDGRLVLERQFLLPYEN